MTKPVSHKISELGEFGLISRIAAEVSPLEGVITGIGDDAAVTALTSGMQLLTSTDMLLEDVHFCRSWHDPYRLGRKSLAVNISDIASMGGIPRWALLSLAIPVDLPLDFLDLFTAGFLSMATEHGVSLVGGDTCSSGSGLVISVTIMGEQFSEHILRRAGARPGDEIWVTGTLGDAALGLKLLEGGFDSAQPPDTSLLAGNTQPSSCSLSGVEENDFLIARLLDPTPRISAGLALAMSGLVTAMIDVSDGILSDFGHIAEMSGAGGTIQLEKLPLSDAFMAATRSSSPFPHHLVLSGGEDYELCFTALPAYREKIAGIMKNCGVHAAPVGIVTSSKVVVVVNTDGSRYNVTNSGFNHFS
ncbi:MAG: thiamine-phosphate kinase [Verrucomicrobia bacterium]|nr:thiamine-phosphate kinase [Deltaproteobacteria bacterium]